MISSLQKRASAFVLFVVLAGGIGRGEELPRTWTNRDGKTVTGTLVEKGDGFAGILIKGRKHQIKLSTLSEEDREYVANAKLFQTLRMRVQTVKAESSNADKGLDIRRLKVELENVGERKLNFRLIWIAQTRERSTYGRHREVTKVYENDGEYFHQETFYTRSANGAQYKGYAARITDEDGNTLAETASMRPFLRFLDEADPEDAETVR